MTAYTITTSGQIVRSSDGAFIPSDQRNADYRSFLSWQAQGNTAAITPASLMQYASGKHQTVSSGGVTVNVGGSVGSVEASTDTNSLVILNGAYTMAQANGSETFQWVQSTGVAVTLTSAQVITIFNAVSAFIQNTFAALSTAISGINGGTITTTAGIDAVSWPTNS